MRPVPPRFFLQLKGKKISGGAATPAPRAPGGDWDGHNARPPTWNGKQRGKLHPFDLEENVGEEPLEITVFALTV
jgi:hypothetical protein